MEEKIKIEFICTKVQADMLKRYYEFICQNDFHLPNDAYKDAPFLKEKNSEIFELMLPSYLKAIIDEIKSTDLKNGWRRGQLSMMLEAEIHNAENDHMITDDQAEYLRKNYLSFLDNYEPK